MLVVKCKTFISKEEFDQYVEKLNKQVKENGFLIIPAGFDVVEINSENLCKDGLTAYVDSG